MNCKVQITSILFYIELKAIDSPAYGYSTNCLLRRISSRDRCKRDVLDKASNIIKVIFQLGRFHPGVDQDLLARHPADRRRDTSSSQ